MFKPLFICLLCILASACGFRVAKLQNVREELAPPQASALQVEQAILQACDILGWKCTQTAPGAMEGVLYIRTHMAAVNISYSTDYFAITYRDSDNLKYQRAGAGKAKRFNPNRMTYDDYKFHQGYGGETDVIHNQYNNWINYLKKRILFELEKTDGTSVRSENSSEETINE